MNRVPVLSWKRLAAWGSYGAFRLQRAGVIGLACAVVAVALVGLSAWVLEPAADRAASQVQALQAQLDRPPPRAEPAPGALLLASLPPMERAPRFVQAVHEHARRHGVQIERAEYRTPDTGDARLRRLQVVVPAQGPYPGLKRWLAALLVDFPACAVDEMVLTRAAGEAQGMAPGTVQARISLSLYMQGLQGGP